MVRKHYGWVICAGCFLLNFCALGLVTGALSVYFPYMKEMLRLTNTQISLISTARSLSSAVTFLFVERYYSLLGLRRGAALSGLILAFGCMIFAFSKSIGMYYLAAMVIGIPFAVGALFPHAIFMRNWFEDRQTTATAIAMCGSSACSILMPPAITTMVESRGLRRALLTETAGILLISLTLYAILRGKPEDMGMEPYKEENAVQKKKVSRRLSDVRLTKAEVTIFTIAMFMMGVSGAPYTAAFTIHYRTQGYSSILAATAMSVYGLLLAAGKCMYGAAVDKKGTYRVNFIFQTFWVVASFMTAMANGVSQNLLFMAAMLNGLGVSLGSVGVTVWSSELADNKSYVRSVRRCNMVNTFGSLLGAPLPGIIADLTGSYSPVYIMYSIILAFVFCVVQVIYRKQTKLQLY